MGADSETADHRPPERATAAGPTARRRLIDAFPGPGTRLGDLLVLGELGRGAFGVVLRARDPSLGRDVAVKLLLDPADGPALQRFAREGQLLATLDAPGILRVHGTGEHEGRPYLVVELVEGARPLDVAARGLPLAARVALVRDAARALGHAHARGVVHRDVKPSNLLVDAAGAVRVADFGLAVAADVERLTLSGAVLGTLGYMAPEQVAGLRDAVGPAADVWALGVVLYELCCDQLPFDGESPPEVMRRIAQAEPAPPRALAPGLSPAVQAVLLRALARAPDARWRDGAALAAALDDALVGRAPRGRRLPWAALAASLPLVAVGAVALSPRARSDLPPARPTAPPAPATSAVRPPPSGVEGDVRARAEAGQARDMRELGRSLGATPEGLRWLEQAAERGDAVAAREVGLRLLGDGATQALALTWLRRAADAGDAQAATALLEALSGGLSRAELASAATAAPPIDSVTRALLLLASGDPWVEPQAVDLLARAIDASALARQTLAQLAVEGRVQEGDLAERLQADVAKGALAWPERSLELLVRLEAHRAHRLAVAEQAFPTSARLTLARELRTQGRDAERRAVLEEAANEGSSEAMYQLVEERFRGGHGDERTLAGMRLAAALGEVRACEALGMALLEGKVLTRDLPRAAALLRRAAAEEQNLEVRGRLGAAILDAAPGDTWGLAFLEEAATAGEPRALLGLAERLVDGRLPVDLARAAELLEGRRFEQKYVQRVDALQERIARQRR